MSQESKNAKPKSKATSDDIMKKILSKAHTHEKFENTRDWLVYVNKEFQMTHNTRICRVTCHQFDKNDVHCLLEITEPLLPSYVALAAKIGECSDAFSHPKELWIDLASAISALDSSRSTSHLIIDTSLVGKIVILELSDKATVSINMDDLINSLNSLRPVTTYDFSCNLRDTILPTRSLPQGGRYIVPQRRAQSSDESDVETTLHPLATQQVNANITATSLEILRHTTSVGIIEALTSFSSAVTQPRSAKTQIDEWLDQLAEQIMRSRISISEGLPWCEPIRIRSLMDLVFWVGKGIRATEPEIDLALDKILSFVFKTFSGFEKGKDDEVEWSDLDCYSKLCRWIDAANRKFQTLPSKPDTEGLRYKETLDIISHNLEEHRIVCSDDEYFPDVVTSLVERLKYRESRTALAALFFLIDDGDMIPKPSEAFSSWKRPEINLEFDHKGSFHEMCGSFVYEGGESELASTGIESARLQLEKRFRLIDAVADLGFNITCHYYTGKVFVPYLPENIMERKWEKPIRFIRRKSPASASSNRPSKVKQPKTVELAPIDSLYLFKLETLEVAVDF